MSDQWSQTVERFWRASVDATGIDGPYSASAYGNESEMADLLGEAESLPVPEIEHQNFAFKAENRGQALALLDNVAGFFRQAEPSNPVPLLMEKAREMAQRDFISVLREVLPDGALKDRR